MTNTILVLTGTETAGKTTLADALVVRGHYVLVPAVTTRAKRADDNGRYRYLSAAKFAKHESEGDLAVATDYRGMHYGILLQDLNDAVATGNVAIVTLTPHSVDRFVKERGDSERVVSFFVDSEDAALDERLLARGVTIDRELRDRRERDRSFREQSTYSLMNREISDSISAIETLVKGEFRSGILPHQWLAALLGAGMILENFEESNIQAASYDLSLGDEYFYGGRVKRLSSTKPVLTIEPYDYAIVTSRERARMPRDMAGRFDLSVGLFSQGVVLSNGPQIDPGFEGNLFCLLLNTSSSPVLLRRGHHYATLEISRILEPSDEPYAGARQGKGSILDYLPSNAARGAINELKRDLEQLRKESSRLQTFFIAALSIMFAVVALLAATR